MRGTHPLSVGVVGSYPRESANRAVNRADLVCFIGPETGGLTTHFWAVPKIGTRAIQIDIEPETIGRNYPLEASVLGDAKSVLAAMEIGALRKEWYGKYEQLLRSEQVPIHPARICHELSQHVPDDAMVVVDTGHAGVRKS
jgi:acetolactate synthase I/II/III large subunit